ncbi:MAG: hypothetical protein HY897_23135 [Deltaproteobacteria bacterium]|nr:hypothetical protein [Deltaproteobacteria bacterium]
MNIWFLIAVALAAVAGTAVFKWFAAVRGTVEIAVGSRGPTVRSFEIASASSHLDTVRPILDFVAQQDAYRIWLVMETPVGRAANARFSETDYFIEQIGAPDAARRLDAECRNLSMFFLNADPGDNDKLLLAHDLLVRSAQIPERAFLGDTGAVVTLMRASDLLQIVSVAPPAEAVFHDLCDMIAKAGKRAVVRKS